MAVRSPARQVCSPPLGALAAARAALVLALGQRETRRRGEVGILLMELRLALRLPCRRLLWQWRVGGRATRLEKQI